MPDTLVLEKRIEWWAKRSGLEDIEEEGDYDDNAAGGAGPYQPEEGKPRLPDEDCGS